MTVFDAIWTLVREKQPFIAFRLPGDRLPTLYYGGAYIAKKLSDNFPSNVFIIAPFQADSTAPNLIYTRFRVYDGQLLFNDNDEKKPGHNYLSEPACPPVIDKVAYLQKVSSLISLMQEARLKKIVFSRVISQKVPQAYDWTAHYSRLCERYSTAFVYFAALSPGNFWLGASPEILIKYQNHKGQTMALAGTQPRTDEYEGNYYWGDKEIEEQAYVRRNIHEVLKNFGTKWLHQEERLTQTAGNMVHLLNRFHFELPKDKSALALAEQLHPTPAICGQPSALAQKTISAVESHNRSYYTGYLGPVDKKKKAHLYVNLRCMQIIKDQVFVYVGGGLTADSDPLLEWEETQLKAETMLSVFSK